MQATKHFARTVFAELKGAGYAHDDVLRFVNEVMALLSDEVRAKARANEPPGIFDAEGGVLDRETIHEVLEFQLKGAHKDRRKPPVTVVGVDVVLPTWVASSARAETHQILASNLGDRLRTTDSLGKLGPDRYLLVLPESKPGVVAALQVRLKQILHEHTELSRDLTLHLYWARDEGRFAVAAALLETCFAQPAETVSVSEGADRIRSSAPSTPRTPLGRHERHRVVLCLGGGAARAASHAGVLAALGDKGIEVVGIAGSSGGALVGAMHASGKRSDEIVRRFANFAETSVYREMRRAYATFLRDSRRRGSQIPQGALGESSLPFYSETKVAAVSQELLEDFVQYFVGPDSAFSSLQIPLAVAATDLLEGRAVVLSHGSIHAALAASVAVPGLFPLQKQSDRLLVDGAAVGEVPIGAAHMLGLTAPVLAVHLQTPTDVVAEYHSSAEIVSRLSCLVHRELVREQLSRAGFLISLPVQDTGWLEFRRAETTARVGEAAASSSLEAWLRGNEKVWGADETR